MSLSNKVLATLKQNAKQADETIALLRKHLAILEKEASGSGNKIQIYYEQRKTELRRENDELREKARNLKTELEKVERESGLKIVSLPKGNKKAALIEFVPSASAKLNEQAAVVKEQKPNVEGSKERKEKKDIKKEKKPAKPKTPSTEAAVENVDVSRLDLRIGCIVKVEKHPDADTLYLEEIDVGEEKPRTVVSGLVKHIPIEKMQNRMVMALCNLKPAKMRGVFSQAMVMCASSSECVEILDPPSGSIPGDKVICEGYPGTPDSQLNPKRKIFEKIQPDLHTDEHYVAKYKGSPFVVVGKDGYFKAQTMKNSNIK